MSGILILLTIVILYRKRSAFGANADPSLIPGPLRRVLLIFTVVGLVLIATMPEALFVLPAFDAVGLDVATILIALELQRYLEDVLLVATATVKLLWRRILHLYLKLAAVDPIVMRRTVSNIAMGASLLVIAGATLAVSP